MTIPSFIQLEHDTAARKAYISVLDKEVKKQREMWGTIAIPFPILFMLANSFHRDDSRILTEPHSGRIGRTLGNPEASGCWVPSYS